jgi:hypothetical protein
MKGPRSVKLELGFSETLFCIVPSMGKEGDHPKALAFSLGLHIRCEALGGLSLMICVSADRPCHTALPDSASPVVVQEKIHYMWPPSSHPCAAVRDATQPRCRSCTERTTAPIQAHRTPNHRPWDRSKGVYQGDTSSCNGAEGAVNGCVGGATYYSSCTCSQLHTNWGRQIAWFSPSTKSMCRKTRNLLKSISQKLHRSHWQGSR